MANNFLKLARLRDSFISEFENALNGLWNIEKKLCHHQGSNPGPVAPLSTALLT
jgi:hypothetical protein